ITGMAREGHVLLMVGECGGHLGQSALLLEVFNRAEGEAPLVDLAAEKRNGDFIRDNRALINACTDLSDGGLALAAFEMAHGSGVGVVLDSNDTNTLFGEDQGRYLIACSFDKAEALMIAAVKAGVPIQTVGKFSGDTVWLGNSSAPLSDLSDIYHTTFATALA
ncbi:MAG: AIR synthase-related protein, partial [Pseudomonadota bacterium]